MLELANESQLEPTKTWAAKEKRAYRRAALILPALTTVFMSVELTPLLSDYIQSWGEWGLVTFRAITFSLMYFFVRDYYRCKSYAQIEVQS